MKRFFNLMYDVCLHLDFMRHKTKNPKNSATNFSDFLLFLVENTEGPLRLGTRRLKNHCTTNLPMLNNFPPSEILKI
jgi:hypothetical protein